MSDRPKRIQLKRTKGWRLPPNTVIVDRRTIYGNPCRVDKYGQELAVEEFRKWLAYRLANGFINIEPLRDKDLACWCPLSQPCHADVLLELANKELAK